MSYDDQLRKILKELDEKQTLNEVTTLPEIPRNKFFNMVEDLYKDEYIDTSSNKGVLSRYKGGAVFAPQIWVTRIGYNFLEDRNDTMTPTLQYNIHSVSNSNFGDHGSVTNNYGASISDIKSLIDLISDPSDKAEATELVEIIEAKEPIKLGLLKRFDNLLAKYPEISKTAGKLLLSFATGMFE